MFYRLINILKVVIIFIEVCMKYLPFFLLILLVVGVVGFGLSNGGQPEYDYFRIHIRANSNLEVDQQVKYKVKGEVVNFITPYLIDCDTKDDSIEVIAELLDEIENVCDRCLAQNGFYYTSTARIAEEEFPTRVYDNVTLEAGVYDALIIELGEGVGDNWWCIVYPPLCFVNNNEMDAQNIQYQSYLIEKIKKYFG